MGITTSPSKESEPEIMMPEGVQPISCEPKDDVSSPDSEEGWKCMLSCNCPTNHPMNERVRCCDTMIEWVKHCNLTLSEGEIIDKLNLVAQ